MALKDTWKPQVDGVDEANASAVNEIADAVIYLEENGISGGTGRSPYIGDNGNWYQYDDVSGAYVDTGIVAEGYTPQKGVDYFTETDKADIVNDVLSALPNGDEVSY